MQFERVCRVTMCSVTLQIGRQVDDVDRAERAFLRTDTATHTEFFRDECDLVVGCYFDTELA